MVNKSLRRTTRKAYKCKNKIFDSIKEVADFYKINYSAAKTFIKNKQDSDHNIISIITICLDEDRNSIR